MDDPGEIGVAGCGAMGLPMLTNLRRAGFTARGYDTRPSDAFGKHSGAVVNDPDAFRQRLAVLLTVLPDEAATEDALFGRGALAATPGLGWIVICSTLPPRYLDSLRGRVSQRIRLVDAALDGTPDGAHQHRLTFLLGGSIGDLDRLYPLFDAMGSRFHRMGSFGAGTRARLLLSLLTATNLAVTRQVLAAAKTAGIKEEAMLALATRGEAMNGMATEIAGAPDLRAGFSSENLIGGLANDLRMAGEALEASTGRALCDAVAETLRDLAAMDR